MGPGTLAWTSNYSNGSTSETSEIQSDLSVKDNYLESDKGKPISENNTANLSKDYGEDMEEKYSQKLFDGRINLDQIPSSTLSCHQDNGASSKCYGSVASAATDTLAISDLQFSPDTLVVLPLDEQQKMSRLLTNMQQRLVTSKTDVEDLMTRINQELAVRQYLNAKVFQYFHPCLSHCSIEF